jgi:predicted rRNA methylase YqxC with S4 and FtsJ domains
MQEEVKSKGNQLEKDTKIEMEIKEKKLHSKSQMKLVMGIKQQFEIEMK